MLLFEEGIPGWKVARLPLDGTEAVAEKYIQGEELKALLTAKPPPEVIDLRSPAEAKQSPLKGARAASVEDAAKVAKGAGRPLLLVASHELLGRIARLRLIEAAVPADQVFVVRGGKAALDAAAPGPWPKH